MAEHQQEQLITRRHHHYKGKILVIDEYPELRKLLARLINEQIDTEQCIEAENADIASKRFDCEALDFALIDMSTDPNRAARAAELLKLRCPMLPVMALSIETKAAAGRSTEIIISPQQSDRILAGIRYMLTLIRSGLSGFTIMVKAGNEPDYF